MTFATNIENVATTNLFACQMNQKPSCGTPCFIVTNEIVVPPNSNAYYDWARMCHFSCVKTIYFPRANITH